MKMIVQCEFIGHRLDYVCIVVEAQIIESKPEIEGFVGEHQEGKNSNDVNRIEFRETTVEFFPRGLSKHFPNLTELTIYKCGLKKISMDDLEGLDDLISLNLFGNKLVSLPDNLLVYNRMLKRITFCENQLEHVNSLFLQPICENEIEFVDFRYNKKIDAFYEPGRGWPGSTNTLQELMEIIDVSCGTAFNIELWTGGLVSDFVIAIGSKEYRVHKNYLALKSSVFIEMFAADKNASKFKMSDFSIGTVEDFLRFIYGVDYQIVYPLELFAMASDFKVEELKSKCEEKLSNLVDKSNAMEIFTLAHQHASEPLKIAAFNILKKMFPCSQVADEYMNNLDDLKAMLKAVPGRKRKIKDEFDENVSKKK